ncbi:helix-turn-helix domain-containing protein [Celeribacter ethanolicus]|uniref:Helix-turn-helix domain-containing protein n=1 Tax=Celeribacter ethanolicus TaxID=1758178 RepID=A0A291GA72_9RHOB|nr:helix-turn-helix domain-containing protein [Celeribacter ethanolicus]ATG46954.1 helix-turn-helix domain-containing protein [Celeribacter ethanolicus]
MIGRWSKPPVEDTEHPRGFDDFELKLGDIMRGERATIGKSLLDVQRELKIKATYIAAIENADPSVFETQGFIAGYVRSYARYLDLDPDWAFARFCQESGFAVAHGMSPQASTKRSGPARTAQKSTVSDPFANPNASFVPRGQSFLSRIEPGALGSSAVLFALLGVIGYGGWTVLQEIQKVKLAPVDQAPGVISEVAPLGGDQMVVAGMDESVSLATPSAEALDRLYRPQALDVPVLVPRDGPIASLDPREVGALAGESAAADRESILNDMSNLIADAALSGSEDSPVQVTAGDAPQLALVAVLPSWVRVQAADGSVIFEKILDAGERYVVPAMEQPPVLRTGNGGGVYFAVNGQAYGPVGSSGEVVKNVALSVADVSDGYGPVDLAANDSVAEMFRVAQNAE